MEENIEHRHSPRISVDLDVEIRKNGQIIRGCVLNCSMSGMFLRTPDKLECGEVVEITVRLPGIEETIRATSRVIWTDWNDRKDNPGFGVHFVSLNDDQAILLRTFLYD